MKKDVVFMVEMVTTSNEEDSQVDEPENTEDT